MNQRTMRPGARIKINLPLNLAVRPFVLKEDFESQADWATKSNVNLADNAAQKRTGIQSIQMTSTGAGLTSYMRKTVDLDPCKMGVRLFFYPHNAYLSSITLMLRTAGGSNWWQKVQSLTITGAKPIVGAWNCLDIGSGWSNGGGIPDWANRITAIQIQFVSTAGGAAQVSVDSLYFEGQSSKVAVVRFDDGEDTCIDQALPILAKYHQVANVFVIPAAVGTGTKATVAELAQLQSAGWDICNHTMNHVDLPPLNDAQEQAAWTDAVAWLRANGFDRPAVHYGACPGGGVVFDDQTYVNASAAGMTLVHLGHALQQYQPWPDYLNFPHSIGLGNTDTLASAKASFDQAMTDGRIWIPLLHKLVAAPATSTEWAIADFDELMRYIQQQGAVTLTYSELLAASASPLTIRHK